MMYMHGMHVVCQSTVAAAQGSHGLACAVSAACLSSLWLHADQRHHAPVTQWLPTSIRSADRKTELCHVPRCRAWGRLHVAYHCPVGMHKAVPHEGCLASAKMYPVLHTSWPRARECPHVCQMLVHKDPPCHTVHAQLSSSPAPVSLRTAPLTPEPK